jgi:phage major head subunit gpT-like protein
MAMGRSGPDFSALATKGYIGSFYKALEDEMAGSWATKLGVVIPSNQETETYRWLGQTPQLREWLNHRHLKAPPKYSHTITNATYEASFPVDSEDFRFDKSGQIQLRISELAKRASQHWEKIVTDLITADGLCYDGQNFFDTDHSAGGDNTSTYKNELTASEVGALNVSDTNDPTPNEMKNVIIGLVQHLLTFKDNYSEPYNGGARNFALMVPVNMWGAALTAVRADRLDSAGGNTNAMKTQDFSVEVIPNPRLSTDTVGYFFRTDSAMKPFILQDAVAPTMQFLGEGSDHHFMKNQYVFGVKAVRAAGYGEWAHALKFTLE